MKTYNQILSKRLNDLPQQILLLKSAYARISNNSERDKKMIDLLKYEKRMREGINYLEKIEDSSVIRNIENIRSRSPILLRNNKERYLEALRRYRHENGVDLDTSWLNSYIDSLRSVPLTHTTRDSQLICKTGIIPAANLWLTANKSCANAMDIALGLDECVFFTHGFNLDDFGNNQVTVSNHIIDESVSLVSSLDLFTFVLIKTGRQAPTAIATNELLSALSDYERNIFSANDFWQIKAEYIATFFHSIEEFNSFGKSHFYSNQIKKAPLNEYPFLGEIKVFRSITQDEIN